MKTAITFICVIGIVFLFAVTVHAQGYGYGHGMMGGYNYCPNCGAYMGGGYGQGRAYGQPPSPACQNFLNETQGPRRELMNKRFEYSEAMRNPKTTPENASALRKEIDDLRAKIQAKNDQGCWW